MTGAVGVAVDGVCPGMSSGSRPESSTGSESRSGFSPVSAAAGGLSRVLSGPAPAGVPVDRWCSSASPDSRLEALYSDVHAAISAEFDVSSRLAFATTARISLSLPIRNRWKSRAPAGVSRSERVVTAASISCCRLLRASRPSAFCWWALSTAVTTCRSTCAVAEFWCARAASAPLIASAASPS